MMRVVGCYWGFLFEKKRGVAYRWGQHLDGAGVLYHTWTLLQNSDYPLLGWMTRWGGSRMARTLTSELENGTMKYAFFYRHFPFHV